MRHIEHPGPIAAERRRTANCKVRHEHLKLPTGQSLLTTLARLLESNAADSAVIRMKGGEFDPFAYCMPALSPTPAHAVYFSDRYEPTVPVQLELASVTVGNGASGMWLHCHGIWRDAQGSRLGGHVLPNDAIISKPIESFVTFIYGAEFKVVESPETGFSLFEAALVDGAIPVSGETFALSIRPNEDFCQALEDECRVRGVSRARVLGGVGSLVGVSFDDGREVVPFVTEVFIKDGQIKPDADGKLAADIDVGLVDHLGGLHEGRLRRGANPVLVTFELVVEPLADGSRSAVSAGARL